MPMSISTTSIGYDDIPFDDCGVQQLMTTLLLLLLKISLYTVVLLWIATNSVYCTALMRMSYLNAEIMHAEEVTLGCSSHTQIMQISYTNSQVIHKLCRYHTRMHTSYTNADNIHE